MQGFCLFVCLFGVNRPTRPVAERLAVELSLPLLTTQVCRERRSNPIFRMRGERSSSIYASAAVQHNYTNMQHNYVDMQHYNIDMRYDYVDMRLNLRCMQILYFCMLTWS